MTHVMHHDHATLAGLQVARAGNNIYKHKLVYRIGLLLSLNPHKICFKKRGSERCCIDAICWRFRYG
jgi:hypothetical protein